MRVWFVKKIGNGKFKFPNSCEIERTEENFSKFLRIQKAGREGFDPKWVKTTRVWLWTPASGDALSNLVSVTNSNQSKFYQIYNT